jgi:hypothetical protein
VPYILRSNRADINRGKSDPDTAGELNYLFCRLAISYFEDHGRSYQAINDISGAFTEALAEFRRRVVAPYEDTKIAQNGDLPWPSFEE